MEYLPAIISALGTIAAAWFAYNQYAKNKMTDLKIERWKQEEECRNVERNEHIAKIYGVLWQLLHDMQADRVYIIQPHPLTNNMFLSITLEVRRNGVSEMKAAMQSLPMSDVAAFAAELSQRDFLYFRRVCDELKDNRARALMTTNGCISAIVKRLSDDQHDWIGSIFCEFTRETTLSPTYARKELADTADRIQYILPEYKNTKLRV